MRALVFCFDFIFFYSDFLCSDLISHLFGAFPFLLILHESHLTFLSHFISCLPSFGSLRFDLDVHSTLHPVFLETICPLYQQQIELEEGCLGVGIESHD